VRVLTWNLGSRREDRAGLAAVARVVRSASPDIALIQGAPRVWRWRSACARLARESGLVIVTGGRPADGNLVMCAMRVRVVSSYDDRGRGARAVLEVDGHTVSVLCTHLGLDSGSYDVIGALDDLRVALPWQAMSRRVVECGLVVDHRPIVGELVWRG
jgi:endonuclease/exonuclease/phosphatase family metal-dependent hydrolase